MAAITISLSVFWGIMNLYVDIVKNQVKDQTMADIRFNLSSAMDMISRDVRNADSISISTTTYSKKLTYIILIEMVILKNYIHIVQKMI